MSFSIVMLTWNNMEKLYRCMHTMFYYLTCEHVKEIIILDNGSHQEELLKYLRELDEQVDKVNVIFSNVNLGIGKGRKKLFEMATGDYIISVDSDVVVINPPLLLETIKTALELEDMYMVGGGGGDHPYFPTIEKEHIINKPTPEEGTVTVVDEVAGWFTAFKSEHLTKNGGQLYMDEQFTPFWAEDSDFSIQIKHLGKKSCILGKGLIGHAWSSSHKPETLTTVAGMWEKLRNKWYKNMPEFNIINVDEDFQKSFYDDKSEFISTNWMVKGIMENRLPNKNFITKICPELEFDDDNGTVVYDSNSMKIDAFVKEHLSSEFVMNKCLTLKEDNLKPCKTLTFFTAINEEGSLRVLEKCESLHDLNVVLLLRYGFDHTQVISRVKKLTDNYRIYTVEHLHHRFKLMSNLVQRFKDFEFETFLNISSETSDEFFDILDLELQIYQSVEKKADLYGIELITEVHKVDQNLTYPENGDFFIPKSDLYKTVESLPYKTVLNKVTPFEDDTPLNVLPRVSPDHSLNRLFGYLQHYDNKSTLMIILCKLDEQSQLEDIKNLISRFRVRDNLDVMLVNSGTLQKIKMSYLGVDYYYNINSDDNKFVSWLKLLSTVELNDYSNFIFSTDEYELDEDDDIGAFLDVSKYKSSGYMLEENRIKSVLFSIYKTDLQQFNNIVVSAMQENEKKKNQSEDFDITESIEKNLLRLNPKCMVKV